MPKHGAKGGLVTENHYEIHYSTITCIIFLFPIFFFSVLFPPVPNNKKI